MKIGGNKLGIKRIEVEFCCSNTVEDAWNELQEVANKNDVETYGSFNTIVITSKMTLDEAYIAVTGKTKEDTDRAYKDYMDKLKQEEEEHKANIPTLEKEWVEKAKGIIREDKLSTWNEIVPIRLGDLYRGMELRCTLKLVEMLDINNCELDEAKEEFYNQGHSVMSAGLMFAMLREFCVRAEEFIAYVN